MCGQARFVKVPLAMSALLRFGGVILGCTMLVSCTRGVTDLDNPVAPTPTPTLSKLTITPVDGGTMMIGGSATIVSSGTPPGNAVALGAFAEFSNGSARYVEATWTSSNPGVVSVANGTLTAVGRGSALVTATFQGQSDDAPFEVIGGITGSWAGTYVVEQCSGSSGSINEVMCTPPNTGRPAGFAHVGARLPVTMELTESGDDVTGVISIGGVRGTLAGKNRGAGYFYLTGMIETSGGVLNISHWDTRVQRDEMQGFINYQVRINSLPGTGNAGTRLVDVTRR